MKQEAANAALLGNVQTMPTDVTSGTSNGSAEKKDTSPECQDSLQADHTKETTPSTSENAFHKEKYY